MSIFDEPIMIDGKKADYKPPNESELIDLEKLSPWLAGPTLEEEKARKLREKSLLIEMREESKEYYNC